MSMRRTQYCIANWKMNFTTSDVKSFMNEWKNKNLNNSHIETIFCPSFTELNTTAEFIQNSSSKLGAQNVAYDTKGAFTGEVSCRMLKELGCEWVIIGHSERRNVFGETDDVIQKKLDKIVSEGMSPILCIGESKKERDTGNTQEILSTQLSNACRNLDEKDTFLIAYEPIWAIGTGVTATTEMIYKTHQDIENILIDNNLNGEKISILYGGSVTDKNASELSEIDNVDGFLVGGASLDVNKFYSIYKQL